MVTVKIPAMMDVATTDLVCRNTQKVTANQTKLLTTDAAREFPRTA